MGPLVSAPWSQGLPSKLLTQSFISQIQTAPQRGDWLRKKSEIIAEASLLLEKKTTITTEPSKNVNEQKPQLTVVSEWKHNVRALILFTE